MSWMPSSHFFLVILNPLFPRLSSYQIGYQIYNDRMELITNYAEYLDKKTPNIFFEP
jgi:hypothetical protein